MAAGPADLPSAGVCRHQAAPVQTSSLYQEDHVEHQRFGEGDRENGLHEVLAAAPGLRPTAKTADEPIAPMPSATLTAVIPMWRFSMVCVLPCDVPEVPRGRPDDSGGSTTLQPSVRITDPARGVRAGTAFLVVPATEHDEDGRQEGNTPPGSGNQQLDKVERYRQVQGQGGHLVQHRLQHGLAREDIAKEAQAQGDGPERDQNHLQEPGRKKTSPSRPMRPFISPWAQKGARETADPLLWTDHQPAATQQGSHAEGQVQVSVGAPQQRPGDVQPVRRSNAPADRPSQGQAPASWRPE